MLLPPHMADDLIADHDDCSSRVRDENCNNTIHDNSTGQFPARY
jgi:hypothetical protein